MNITVVVLHYENIKDTRECLDSLKKYLDDTKNNINVVVVDNGSIKEKTAAIEKEYLNDKIHFIESGENLGFAKGNNIGFHYAKYELHSDIIILANNDLIFQQVDFMDQIEKEMTENHIDVAGPRIISLVDHVHGEAVLRLLKPFHSHLPVLPYNRHFPKEIPGAYHQRNLSQ